MKRLMRKTDRAVRTFVRTTAAVTLVLAAVFYRTVGTLSPYGALREAARQHDELLATLPDGLVDFALEAQFGEMSAGRCIAVCAS